MTGVFHSVPRYDWCTPLLHPASCMFVNHGPSQQSSQEEYKPWKWGATARYHTSHTKTMLPTRKSVPRSSRQRPPDHHKDTQTAVVWSCLPFIRSGKNHLVRHSERGKKTRQTEEEVGRQHQGMDRCGVHQVPEGSGEQGKMERNGCKIICGAPTTLVVKGLMIMMMMKNICQNLRDGSTHWALPLRTTFSYFDCILRSRQCQFWLKMLCSSSIKLKLCTIADYVK